MRIRFDRNIVRTALTCIVLLASGPSLLADDPPQYSPWSAAVLVASPINGDGTISDDRPFIAKNNLDLYFRSTRLGGNGLGDIYVSHRDTVDDPWETPINLGPEINTAFDEADPFVTIDGHWLYFVSGRPDGCGGHDLWVSHRKDKRDDDSWETPKNLGCIVNSSATENSPAVFEDEATGQTFLYFGSNRPGGKGGNDIYVSTMVGEDHEIFGAPINVSELNTTYGESVPFVRRKDGLEIIFASGRPGGVGPVPWTDLWVSTRPDTLSPWSTPVNLGAPLNTPTNEVRPSLSWDGTTLYLSTDARWQQGDSGDVSMATRTKLKGKDKDPD